MRGSRLARGIAVLLLLGGLWAMVGSPAGAAKFLTKKKAKKLFYTKVQAEAAFLDQAEGDARYVNKAQVSTGFVSCPALAWQEHNSGQTYDALGTLRYTGNSGTFHCNVALPHGATVTAIRFTVRDDVAGSLVIGRLIRVSLATGIGGSSEMAVVATSMPGTPGDVRLTETTITDAVVDNDAFAYQLVCEVGPSGTDIGFFGASVEYQLAGAQGAAA